MVSIIIINFKQKKYLADCIDSIFNSIKSVEFEIIIINNSPEEKLNEIVEKYNSVRVIDNSNFGFSQGNNLGARNAKGEYLFFLNPDTIIKKDIFKDFFETFSNRNYGAVGFKLFYPDGTFQISFGLENNIKNEKINKKSEKSFNKRDKVFMNEVETLYSEPEEVDWVSGAAMIMKKVVFDVIGQFDERYFLYYEDADLCKRLKDMGYQVYFFPYSEIIHFKGENTNEEFNEEAYYYSKKSQLHYYKKYNSLMQNIMLRFYLFVKFLFKYLTGFKKVNFRILQLVFKNR